MFNWIKSPTLPDTIETQAFRSISGGPTLRINTINDRTHRMQLVPWEDILEIFPTAIYLRDANGIVMPARDNMQKRISPKSFKLQADVVLEVVSTNDEPPTSARSENITTSDDDDSAIQSPPTTGITGGRTSSSSFPRGSTDLDPHRSTTSSRSSIRASSESAHAHIHTHTHTPKRSSESSRKQSQEATPRAWTAGTAAAAAGKDDDDDDWSPFQANSSATFPAPQTLTIPGPSSTRHTHTHASSTVNEDVGGMGQHGIMASNEILRQEMIHRLELLSAEQEERLSLILTACRNRPPR